MVFLTGIAQMLWSKAKIKLNTKRLYAADGCVGLLARASLHPAPPLTPTPSYAVKELLKVATQLYQALRASEKLTDDEEHDLEAPRKPSFKEIEGARALSREITDRGAKLFDLLGKEQHVRTERASAMAFLDSIASNLDSSAEHDFIERSLQEHTSTVKENIESLTKECSELKATEDSLGNQISKKLEDTKRAEKRLKHMQKHRPPFMDEYEKLERELQKQYEVYIERFRNLDYLEYELDGYDKTEKEKLEENNRSLKRMQKRLREEELRLLRGEAGDPGAGARGSRLPKDKGGGERSDYRGGKGEGAGRAGSGGRGRRNDETQAHGSMDAGNDSGSHSEDISDDDVTNDDDSDAVSLQGTSVSGGDDDDGSDIDDIDEDDDSNISEGDEGFGDFNSDQSDQSDF